jgi:hypothetical protein
MNWEAIGALGEIAGAIGVIVTLFYLTTQIRQNTKSMRASARQALIDTFYDYVWELGKDESLNDIVGRGLSDFESLSDGEKSRFGNLLLRWEGNLYNGILLREADLLDDRTLNEIGDRFVATIQTKGGSVWYRSTHRNPVVELHVAKRMRVVEIPDLGSEMPYWIKEQRK